jgi:hypothetical protein
MGCPGRCGGPPGPTLRRRAGPSRPGPAPAYTPAACGNIPKILDHSSGGLAAYLQVDRYTQLFVQDADPADGPANHDNGGQVKNERTVETKVDARSASGADAAAAVTRTFTAIGSRDPSSTYHVVYYAVHGVLLECTIYMEGDDVDLVQRSAAQTLEKLRAL